MTARTTWHYPGDLARDLIDRAVVHLAEEGPEAVSLRGLARELGVSHAAPAAHFGDRRGLFVAIAGEGFAGLAEALEESWSATDGKPAGRRIEALGRAYASFAAAQPGHYAIMFRHDLLAADGADDAFVADAGARVFARFGELVGKAQQDGWAPDASTVDVATTLWAAMHGAVSLMRTGTLVGATGVGDDQDPAGRVAALLTEVLGRRQ